VYEDRLSGLIGGGLCKMKMAEIQERQRAIKAKMETLERENTQFIEQGLSLFKLGKQMANKAEKFSFEQKRTLLRLMLQEGTATKDGKISYQIAVPFDLFLSFRKGKHPWPDSNRRHMD
jgi:hypothetical protein